MPPGGDGGKRAQRDFHDYLSGKVNGVPWIWILVILSAIVGPFEAMHAMNRARRNREERQRREKEEQLRRAAEK